jgi:hypothetical protein
MKSRDNTEGDTLTRVIAFLFRHLAWLMALSALLIGMVIIFHMGDVRKDNPWLQLLYEIGFALIVSAVVSAIYELHERIQFEKRTLTGVLKGVIDEMVVPGVWDAIHSQIVDKHIFRQGAILKIKLFSSQDLPDNLQKLHVNLSYKLFSARLAPKKTLVRHQLNFHLRSETDDLPRFERIIFGRQNMAGQTLLRHVNSGVFSMLWDPAKESNPLDVSVERVELTNVPGSYYFTFLELTRGIKIELDELPDDVEVVMSALPDPKLYKMNKNEIVELSNLFLPGQSIELRFTRRSRA